MGLLRFDQLCDGEFMAMVKLSPRIPLRDSMFIKTFTSDPHHQDNGNEQVMVNTHNEKKKLPVD